MLVGSAVLHAGALLWIWRALPTGFRDVAHAPAAVEVTVVPPPGRPPAPDDEPLEVTILDEPPAEPESRIAAVPRPLPVGSAAPRATGENASASRGAAPLGDQAASRGHGETASGMASGGGEPHGSDLWRMRGPDLSLARDAAERIASEGPPAPSPVHESGRLENVSGGGAVIHDRVTTVDVERDGTAHFHDKPDIDIHFHVPIPHLDVKQDLHDLGDMLEDWYRDPYAMTRTGPSTDLSEINQAEPGQCDGWGSWLCDDPYSSDAEKRARNRDDSSASASGNADLSAYLYRKLAHADPYASRKLRLLDDTRAERIERGERFRAEQAARSAELMQRTLEELWATTTEPATRREALYELWSDCADDDAGRRARAMVIGWIRARLPPGTADAYTGAELARMAPFQPYE
ncbi:MAG TPA: hypothetical protein VLX92_03055 [Kofleriaceae bacterium]|nr:hypothetical protein [Kofleriaceae bacterium]